MKKLLRFSSLFVLMLALFIAACKKDDIALTSASNGPANPNNPYDFIGQRHNEGLDVLAQYGNDKSMDLNEKIQTLAAHGFGKVDSKPFVADLALILSSADPIKTIADQLESEHSISAQLHASLIALNNIVQNYAMSAQLTEKVIAFEHNISSLGLDEKETKVLFVASSVARYSNAYWINTYGQDPANETAERKQDPPKDFIEACDVVGAIWAITHNNHHIGEISAYFSELGAEYWDIFCSKTGRTNNLGWAWGGGLYGPPCHPGYACPCTIELNPGAPDLFYMDGFGAALSTDMVVLSMDGSKLDPGFLDIFKTGTFNEEVDYTVPEEIVKEVYSVGGIPMPSGASILVKGAKKVTHSENAYCIEFPITYAEGNTVTWYVTINL